MRAALSFIGLMLALGIVYYLYISQADRSLGGKPPKQQIDLTGVRLDLLSLAQAERLYLAANGTYATLEELRQAGNESAVASKRGYSYFVELEDGRHFRITSSPSDPSKAEWPTLSIDETMQVKMPESLER
jgi:hypothetical protein